MEISNKEEQDIVKNLITAFGSESPLCLQSICTTYNKDVINGIINREYSLVIKQHTNDTYRNTFYKLVQICMFIRELVERRYLILDLSVKNKNPNDYTSDGYPFFSFQEDAGDFQLGRFIANHWTIPLIPTSELIRLKDNKFINTDERRYRCQLRTNWTSIGIAFFIGVFSPIYLTKCSENKIDETQYEELINALNHRMRSDNPLPINNNDTIHYNGKTKNEKP